MNKNPLIIFDCDGVLVDSESISSRVLAEELRRIGLELENDAALKLFKGGTLKEAFNYAAKKLNKPVEEEKLERIYRKRCKEEFESSLKPIKNVIAALTQIPFDKCVASNGPAFKIKSNLKICNMLHFFPENGIFSAYDIKRWKPKPDLFLYAAKSMGYKPKDCIVVEDSDHGIEAAVAAGMKVFGYSEDGSSTELFNEMGGIAFSDMSLLKDLISA